MATTPTAVPTSPTTTTASTFCLWTRFIHHQVPPAEILPVQGVDRALRVFVSIHFDERKAARLARETIADEIDARRGYTDLREPLVQLFFRRGKRKIPDVELLHLSLLLPGTQVRVAERAEGTAFDHGVADTRGRRGSETGTSAVCGILPEIDLFCNGKFCMQSHGISAFELPRFSPSPLKNDTMRANYFPSREELCAAR
jgi:hypothetical protein